MPEKNGRRAEILATAAALMASKGVAATTVREIGDAVGMLSGSLYHHFKSKDEIVQEVILGYLDDLLERYDAVVERQLPPQQALTEIVRASLVTIEDHPHATEIYLNDAAHLRTLPRGKTIQELARRVPECWLGIIEAGVASGDFRDDVPARVFYNVVRDSLWQSVMWFDPARAGHTREELAEDLLAIYLEGFSAR